MNFSYLKISSNLYNCVIMSVAYQYGNCYWNASGEFECLGADKVISKKVLEDSIKKYPPSIPCENRQSFVQPTHNYATVPIDQKDRNRCVIEGYQGQRAPRKRDDYRMDDFSPLNREMEV